MIGIYIKFFLYEKLGIIAVKVFACIPPFDFPYGDEDKDDNDEFVKITSKTEEVLKSFRSNKLQDGSRAVLYPY